MKRKTVVNLPENLTEEAEKYMDQVIKALTQKGILDDVDSGALYMLAKNYNTFIIASQTLDLEGLTYTTSTGNVVAHPAVKIAKDSETAAIKIMQEFGLLLKSRGKIKKLDDAVEDSPFAAFVEKR